MFVKAIEENAAFTIPVITSVRFYDKSIKCGPASCIALNPDGWILTAAHIMNLVNYHEKSRKEMAAWDARTAAIKNDKKSSNKQKKRMMRANPPNPKWVTNFSFMWGKMSIPIHEIHIDHLSDLALVRVDSRLTKNLKRFPVFGGSIVPLPQGFPVCRLGFPFLDLKAEFNEAKSEFNIVTPNVFPMPRFPLDGIVTRGVNIKNVQTGRTVSMFEVSTPGLRGQSGGPVFDVNGTVVGIQSGTVSFPLGFAPEASEGNRKVAEHQFLNIGVAISAEEVIKLAKKYSVAIQEDSIGAWQNVKKGIDLQQQEAQDGLQPGPEPAQEPKAEEGKKGSNVEDADYEVVDDDDEK